MLHTKEFFPYFEIVVFGELSALAVFLNGRYLSCEEADFVQLVTADVAHYLKTTDIDR